MEPRTEAKVREVLPGIHLVHLPLPMRPTIVNVYLVDGGDEWALIDTGMRTPESLLAFEGALAAVGCRPEKIRKILCTHHHPDHFGTSGPYRDLCRAEVFLHPLEVERVATFRPGPWSEQSLRFLRRHGIPLERFPGLPTRGEFWSGLYVPSRPDQFLADGDRIQVGEREIQVVWTPGHSPGHCVMYLPREKAAVVGDHLLPKITPHVGIYSDAPQDPLGDFLGSLRKVAELDVETVLPAHGGIYHDHRRRVAQLLEFHEYRLEAIRDVARRGRRTACEIALEAFELSVESPPQQLFPATFETLAHLEHLRLHGRVQRIETEERVVWTV
jgi:glyoxylase-like metal-dependent hydrolase (beta-lactamase superfamily II)